MNRLLFTIAVLAAFVLPSARAEDAAPPTLAAARAALMHGDAKGAERMAEQLVVATPANAAAWRLLGNAAKQTKNYERALVALQRALTLDASNPMPLLQIAGVYALKGDREAAFRSLAKARDTRRVDMTQIETDPSLAPLKNDPRFRKLLPYRKDFEHPFVEPVKILREWDGEHAGDQFGWIARAIGDVDGDRVTDIVTSAPTAGSAAGRVYVYSTASGKLLWSADGKPKDELGTGIEAAGDTNGDGVPDVIASAPGSGHAYVYSGRDGKVLLTLSAEDPSDSFGRHVAGAGDVDHDGFADVFVGAPDNSAGGKGAGRAYLFSGKDGHVLLTLTGEHEGDGFGSSVAGWSDHNRTILIAGAQAGGPSHRGRAYVYDGLASKPKFVLDADETGAALAQMFVTVVGDVDGDNVPDVYASDWSNAAKGPSTGRVYVVSGATGKTIHAITGESAGDGFGTSSSVAGDIDGDGHADLAVGAWQYSRVVVGGGRIYVYSGKDGHLLRTFTSRIPGDTLGFDSVGLGDIDGDGEFDYLVTAGWSGVHGFHSGRVFIISGKRAPEAMFQFDRTPESVRFDNGDVHLSGVLVKPEGNGPFPAVVLVHGAGPATHDEPAFVVHANAFVRRGFAVLAYDKRGSGESSGNLDESDYNDLAADVAAAVRHLRSRPDIIASSIGLLGRSEGAWVSTIAAAHDASIAFVIMSSGCAARPSEQVMYWTRRSLAAKGMDEKRIERAVDAKAAIRAYYRDVLREQATEVQRASLLQKLGEFSDARPEVPSKLMDPAVEPRGKFVAFVHNIDFDPAPLLAELRAPLLEVIGSEDEVVDPATSIAVVERLRARGKDMEVLVLTGVGHSLLVMDHGRVAGYPPNYLDAVIDFASKARTSPVGKSW